MRVENTFCLLITVGLLLYVKLLIIYNFIIFIRSTYLVALPSPSAAATPESRTYLKLQHTATIGVGAAAGGRVAVSSV